MNRRDLFKRIAAIGMIAAVPEAIQRYWQLDQTMIPSSESREVGRFTGRPSDHVWDPDRWDSGIFVNYANLSLGEKTIVGLGFDLSGGPVHATITDPTTNVVLACADCWPGHHHFDFRGQSDKFRLDLVKLPIDEGKPSWIDRIV